MLKAHAYLEPDRLPPIHDLPPEVAELCHRCLAKDPAERPDAGEVASVLADAAGVVTPPPLLPTTVGVAVPPPTTAIVRAPSRRRRLIAAIAAAVLALAGLGVWLGSRSGPPPTAQAMDQAPAASLRCSVRYAVSSALNGRFRTAVSVRNTGARAAGRWRLSFTLPDGQRLVGGTGWQQVGRSAHVGGTALAPGAIASTGFDASYSDAAALPSEFRLNGTVCAAELAVAGQTIGPSSSPAAQIAAGPARPAGAVQVAGPGGAGPGQSEAEPKPKAKPKAKGKPDDKDKGKSGKGKSGKG
jgi:serine/threonine-protein kinase